MASSTPQFSSSDSKHDPDTQTSGISYPSTPFRPAFEQALNAALSNPPPFETHDPVPQATIQPLSRWHSGLRIPLPALILLGLLLLLETSIITIYTAVALWATLPGRAGASVNHAYIPPAAQVVTQTTTQLSSVLVTSTAAGPTSTLTLTITTTPSATPITPKIVFSTYVSTTIVPPPGVLTTTL